MKLILLLLPLILSVLSPRAVFAHAMMTRSEPKAKSELRQMPKRVELWFNEELEPGFNTIEVTDAQGRRVDRGEVTLSEEDKKAQVELGEVLAGGYTVDWKVLSTDQHSVKGRFAFTVTEQPQPPQAPEAPAPVGAVAAAEANSTGTTATTAPPAKISDEQQPASSKTGAAGGGGQPQTHESMPGMDAQQQQQADGAEPISPVMTAVRWLSYLAMMTLMGGFAFRLFVLGPAFTDAKAPGEEERTVKSDWVAGVERRIVRLSLTSALVLIALSVVALVLQAGIVFDRSVSETLFTPSLLVRLITKTGFGGSWMLQLLATICLGALLSFTLTRNRGDGGGGVQNSREKGTPQQKQQSQGWWWFGLLASAMLLAAPSRTGHAAAAVKDYRLAIIFDWLHLVAGGFWVGGLFHLAVSTLPSLAALEDSRRLQVLHRLIVRFTRVAMPSVGLLIFAGLYNAWVHMDSFGALWSSGYGWTLLVKILLVGLMLLLGGLNNFHFGKRAEIEAQGAGESDVGGGEDGAGERGAPESFATERGFSRSLIIEAALGAAVLLVTAVLVFKTPPRNHPPTAVSRVSLSAVNGGR